MSTQLGPLYQKGDMLHVIWLCISDAGKVTHWLKKKKNPKTMSVGQ